MDRFCFGCTAMLESPAKAQAGSKGKGYVTGETKMTTRSRSVLYVIDPFSVILLNKHAFKSDT